VCGTLPHALLGFISAIFPAAQALVSDAQTVQSRATKASNPRHGETAVRSGCGVVCGGLRSAPLIVLMRSSRKFFL